MFAEYDIVKVVKLNTTNRQFVGSENISRPPQVGDTGTVVHTLETNKAFIVEMVDSSGYTVWLADFLAEELEPV
jgi:hypothetical protein